MEYVRKSILTIAPEILESFSWKRLQERSEGPHIIDVQRLKECCEHTEADLNKVVGAGVIRLRDFWEVFEHDFTEEDRLMFVKFVTGKSRIKAGSFDMTIQINGKERNDGKLPTAATCFNTMNIPAYSTKQIMKEQLLKAIKFCSTIHDD